MTDSEKVDMVEAYFGGEPVRMRLDPSPAPMPQYSRMASLEAAIGSTYAALQRFAAGTWRVVDVVHVLKHAYPGAKCLSGTALCPEVDAVLAAGRVANYAPLAQKLLEAFLFGLPADQASFDERQPFGTVKAA